MLAQQQSAKLSTSVLHKKGNEKEREREARQDWVIKILIKASGGILKRNAGQWRLEDRGRGPSRVKWARRNVARGAGRAGERGEDRERTDW